ncbi:MAG: divalent metal cation transporter [Bacteroidota bacterium]|nr:divalent metal cation transporter [Bacteroidota bacterium]MDP4190498.1 divalent metal cation transporter [Bacteroidota bacterium]MDP4194790.1 divalent metal cation transporter [Bacteroidota bacterium]
MDNISSSNVQTPNTPEKEKSAFSITSILKKLGPGLITGASDDDPSGIATYSQVGAQFGLSILWTSLFSYPLMVTIQEISARIGRVSGRGIAGNIRHHYSLFLSFLVVGLMVIANVINIGADIAAMGSSLKLLIGGPALLYSVLFSVFSVYLQVFVPYRTYVNYLKWLTLVLLSYIITAFMINLPWPQAFLSTIKPSIIFKPEYLTSITAILGTTISPYLFFWQSSQEVEELKINPEEIPVKKAPEQAGYQIKRIKVDTYIGMAFSNLIAFFIMLVAATTLHTHGMMDINTAAEAAEALRPFGGKLTFLLFSLGIVGTGLLSIPVLAGSAAYAVGEAFHWKIGLNRKPNKAMNFYGIITAATFLGLALDFSPINPIKALYWAAIINGIAAVPIMIIMMLMSSNKKVMGEFTISRSLKIMGWISTIVMLLAALGLIIS